MPASAADRPNNVILFIADGLRSPMVDDSTAPTMSALARSGVFLRNSHALFPTFTTANASAFATGHYLGDTGDFSNTIYSAFPVQAAGGSVTPFLESDPVIEEVDAHFQGNYLNEETILQMAQAKGYGTAAVGKLGPTYMFDNVGRKAIVIDDSTGSNKGVALSQDVQDRMKAAGLPLIAPTRGPNGVAGDFKTPGTKVANTTQQDFFAAAATRVVLPMLKEKGQPFVMVFWSRDPDGTQHNQGDSLGKLVPGINGPTSLAAIRNADDDLARLRAALQELGLADSTNIIVTADHGFSTISKQSATSPAAKDSYADVPAGMLPVGFLAIDIAKALNLPLADPDANYAAIAAGQHPKGGNGVIGTDKDKPKVVVAANGGSDLIYLPDGDKELAGKVVRMLLEQDYVSGLFVDKALGAFPGTLTLDDIALDGKAVTPKPAIAVNFRSFDTVCGEPARCGVIIADSPLQQGQGQHGSFSRADTWNFMAFHGPDFKAGFIDPAPTSNADVGRTIAHLLGLKAEDKGNLVGRVVTEAMKGGEAPEVTSRTIVSAPAHNGLQTVVNMQMVGETRYFDAAGFPGRTLGLTAPPQPTH
ncbi:alkaline phosphatase family protein [Aquabacter sp. CN5-332]|uniref:alkaline phosphatase family protein n=1 Tax=Aquabacter sp. CN5-332 TaxID=3156608 RepID=UPI0032B41F9B